MPALSMPHLGVGSGGAALGEGLREAGGVQRAAFQDAMTRKAVEQPAVARPADPAAVAAVQPVAPVQPGAQVQRTGLENDPAARDRVRRSLELDGATRPAEGDTILGGLQKLRGAFDARHARVGEIMGSKTVDTNALLAMQMEVAQYTLLVDVSSKLTGKSTQSLDTLMKGQ